LHLSLCLCSLRSSFFSPSWSDVFSPPAETKLVLPLVVVSFIGSSFPAPSPFPFISLRDSRLLSLPYSSAIFFRYQNWTRPLFFPVFGPFMLPVEAQCSILSPQGVRVLFPKFSAKLPPLFPSPTSYQFPFLILVVFVPGSPPLQRPSLLCSGGTIFLLRP